MSTANAPNDPSTATSTGGTGTLATSSGAGLGSRPQLSKLGTAGGPGTSASAATSAIPRSPIDSGQNPMDDYALLNEVLKDDDEDDLERLIGPAGASSPSQRAGGMVREEGGWGPARSGNQGVSGEEDEDEYDVNENLDDAVRKVHQRTLVAKFSERPSSGSTPSSPSKNVQPSVAQQPEVVDDFVRNYLASKGMLATLEAFENEWYDLALTNRLPPEDHQPTIPDVYSQTSRLEEALRAVRTDLQSMQATADRLRTQLDKAVKDRDFFKLHYTRISQEKVRWMAEAKKMRQEVEQVRKDNAALNGKVETLVKERAVARMERDRAVQQLQLGAGLDADAGGMGESARGGAIQQQQQQQQGASKSGRNDVGLPSSSSPQPPSKRVGGAGPAGKKRPGHHAKQFQQPGDKQQLVPTATGQAQQYATEFPAEDRYNPAASTTLSMQPVRISAVREAVSVKAHDLAVSSVAIHPRKLILATVSDDHTWKLWNVPSGELLMTGSGHSDWIADVDFHPKGIHLATASGDMSVKLWDFSKGQASMTLREHTQPVWSCRFHDSGHFLVSGSMDHTAKVWDLVVGKCRQTFRGHSDSVNAVTWQPYTNTFYTVSGDKTVTRGAILFGHTNAVNGIAFAPAADKFATCDSDGIVKVWDPRQASGEVTSMDLGPHPANKVSMDASGMVVAVASNDGLVRLVNLRDGTRRELVGHADAGEYLATGASDGVWKVWH
ncbi:WD40-repeat-containing domain protein [Catenaria anguillulae PL171]|uniref:WD40-repeat-containing domain protein n=1 Tax=Catenaria anguillulae PL171 TaxID=765915 RepID=A0A1Y2H8V5_9FUNG|nr:WD40-repeat-containing domain protein [Catenaria anguillulae PL171]